MPAERIITVYVFDEKTKQIHRQRLDGKEVIEDKTVASYDADKQVVTFPNKNTLRLYKLGVITFLAENEFTIKSMQLGDMKPDAPLNDKKLPPRPKKTPTEGDKTPGVVEWYLKHRWNEFCARYGYLGKYTGKVSYLQPLWEPRPGDGILEYRGQVRVEKDVVDAIVATRKTHVTFTPEECVDWSEEEPEAETPDQGGESVGVRGLTRGGEDAE